MLSIKSGCLAARLRSGGAGAVGLVATAAYEFEDKIKLGSGTFGAVHAAVRRGKGREQQVAINFFHSQSNSECDNEARLICALPIHPNIVRLMDVDYFGAPVSYTHLTLPTKRIV